MDPVFGGRHAAQAHARAAQRRGSTPGQSDADELDLTQTYRVRVDSETDLTALVAQPRRDPDILT